jgi:CubicO group peptidase (beta-lactamase class C family)
MDSAAVDRMMNDGLARFNVAGASVVIVKDGKIVHSKGYGVRSVDTKKPADGQTPFAIGSNTKAFTTAALAILVEEGKLNWKDRVVTHVPEFKLYNDYVTQHFLIEDLLTHRSGLGLGAGDLMFVPDGGDFSIKDILSAFQHFKPQSEFRTKFDYDNLLYFVAGEVIKRVSGMPWEVFVKTRILDQLGMADSYASLTQAQNPGVLAIPHSNRDKALKTLPHYVFDDKKLNGAAGSIYASSDDMGKWILMQLNGGKYGPDLGKQLFTTASQREMWKIHTVQDAGPDPRYKTHFSGYGLGWGLSDMNGSLVAQHGGGLPGMVSRVVVIPDLKFGVVVLSNSDQGAFLVAAASRAITDSYLGLDDNAWPDKMYAFMTQRSSMGDAVSAKVWETVEKSKGARIDPADYIGVYEDPWFGKVEVSEKNGKLSFRSHRSPKLNGEMFYYKANSFAVKWAYQDMDADAFAIFSLDEEGKAQSIRMKAISPNTDFSFDFQDLDLKRVK